MYDLMSPGDFVDPRIGLDVALEYDVHSFNHRTDIEVVAKLECHHWYIYTETMKLTTNVDSKFIKIICFRN